MKAFQQQKENVEPESNLKKKQAIAFLNNLVEIDNKDVKYIKWDKEYLDNLSEEAKMLLYAEYSKKKANPITIFNKDGITKEDLLHICKEHDKIALAKEKDPKGKLQHPLSKDQIKQNEQNKIAQKMKSTTNNNEISA